MLNEKLMSTINVIQINIMYNLNPVSLPVDNVPFNCDTCSGSCKGDCQGSCSYGCTDNDE